MVILLTYEREEIIVMLHVDDEWFVRTGALYDFKL